MAIAEGEERQCTASGTTRAHHEFAFRNAATGKRHLQCRNCCREVSRRHYEQNRAAYIERNRRNTPRLHELVKPRVYRYVLEHPCASCGEADPVVLEFNHRDPSTKVGNISDLVERWASAQRLDAEIANVRYCARIATRNARPSPGPATTSLAHGWNRRRST
jgi:hypothetical protein